MKENLVIETQELQTGLRILKPLNPRSHGMYSCPFGNISAIEWAFAPESTFLEYVARHICQNLHSGSPINPRCIMAKTSMDGLELDICVGLVWVAQNYHCRDHTDQVLGYGFLGKTPHDIRRAALVGFVKMLSLQNEDQLFVRLPDRFFGKGKARRFLTKCGFSHAKEEPWKGEYMIYSPRH